MKRLKINQETLRLMALYLPNSEIIYKKKWSLFTGDGQKWIVAKSGGFCYYQTLESFDNFGEAFYYLIKRKFKMEK